MIRGDIFFPNTNDIRCAHCSRSVSTKPETCTNCKAPIHKTCTECPFKKYDKM